MGYRQPSTSTRMLNEAVLLDLSEAFIAKMQDIFTEHQRQLRVELERACKPLNRLLPRQDEEDLEGGGAGAEFLPLAMATETAVQPEGGRSTLANRGKQTAVGPVDSSEGYLKRIAELEEALRRVKARGKRPETA